MVELSKPRDDDVTNELPAANGEYVMNVNDVNVSTMMVSINGSLHVARPTDDLSLSNYSVLVTPAR